MINRAHWGLMAGVGTAIVACSIPTDVCGCPPARSAIIVRGELRDQNNSPLVNVRLALDGIPRHNPRYDSLPVTDEHRVRTNADGTFRAVVYSAFAPDTLQLRLAIVPEGSTQAPPFAVILARFRLEGTLSDSITKIFIVP